jgi:hypothetical protein
MITFFIFMRDVIDSSIGNVQPRVKSNSSRDETESVQKNSLIDWERIDGREIHSTVRLSVQK